jgi:hypothetical protein
VEWAPGDFGRLTQPRTFAEMAKLVGRSEAAVRWQRSRMLRRRRSDGLSIAAVARHAGYDRSVIERVSRALGHRWCWNGLSGARARYWLEREQADEVLRYLAAPRPWSAEASECRSCHTRGIAHKAHGLCRRCYLRAWKKGGAQMKK